MPVASFVFVLLEGQLHLDAYVGETLAVLVIQINVVLSEISEIELFIGDRPTACFELCVEDLGVYLLLIGDVSLGVKVVVVEDM